MKLRYFGHLCTLAAILALFFIDPSQSWYLAAFFEGIALLTYGYVWGKGRDVEI